MSTRLEKWMRITDEHQHKLVDVDNYHDDQGVEEVHVYPTACKSIEVSNCGHSGNYQPVAGATTLTL
jgi:hypothetical protein